MSESPTTATLSEQLLMGPMDDLEKYIMLGGQINCFLQGGHDTVSIWPSWTTPVYYLCCHQRIAQRMVAVEEWRDENRAIPRLDLVNRIELLIRNKADVYWTTPEGYSALNFAEPCYTGDPNECRCLWHVLKRG